MTERRGHAAAFAFLGHAAAFAFRIARSAWHVRAAGLDFPGTSPICRLPHPRAPHHATEKSPRLDAVRSPGLADPRRPAAPAVRPAGRLLGATDRRARNRA